MVEDYPQDQLAFDERFATDAQCRHYLEQLRWPEGYACPRCQQGKAWRDGRGRQICASCLYPISATAGTIFQDTRKPLRLWFRAAWYVTGQKHGASALGLQRVLGLGGYLTAWSWLHKLRRAMVRPGRDTLRGTVEVDETYVDGLAEGRRGRGADRIKRWLLGTHQGAVRPDHLDYYLDEFTFRFNRRTSRSRGKLFYRLIQQAVQVEPSLYKKLVGGRPLVGSSPQQVGGTVVN